MLTQRPGIRTLFCGIAFFAVAALSYAAPISYSITVDLSQLHAGSSYSGSVIVPNQLNVGDSTPIMLFANPAGDYSPSPLNETLAVDIGPTGFNSVVISPLIFTDTITAKPYDLIVVAAAHCAGPNVVPCQTSGQLTGTNANGPASVPYSVAATAVPEPSYGLLFLAGGFFLAKRRQA